MSPATDQVDCPSAGERIAERCKSLKLPTWRLAGVTTVAEPSGWGPADHWLRSSLLRQWMQQNLDDHPPRREDRARELFPGCWIIPLCTGKPGPGSEITVVMVLFYRQGAVSDLVASAETHNVSLARSFANTIWPDIAAYVTTVDEDGDGYRETRNTVRENQLAVLSIDAAGAPGDADRIARSQLR